MQTNQSVHWTHQFAVLDRVQSNVLVSQKAKKKIRDIELVEILPVQDVEQRLKNPWAVLVSSTVCKFLQALKHLENVAVHHIPHPFSDEMSQKSTSVSVMCSCRKIHTPPQRGLDFLGGCEGPLGQKK